MSGGYDTVINAITDFKTQATSHGLKLPSTVTPTRVRVVFREGRSSAWRGWVRQFRHFSPFVGILVRNDVKLYSKFSDGGNLETDYLYRVVMHELAHISHVLKSPVNSALSLGIVNESFAKAVEYYFTLPYYPDLVSDNPLTSGEYEGIPDQSRSKIESGGGDSLEIHPLFYRFDR